MFKKGNKEWKKGYPVTKERRKRMSESQKTRWARWRIARRKDNEFIEAIKKEIKDYPPVAYLLVGDFLDILKEREKRIKEDWEKEKEFISGNPKAKVNYKIVGVIDSKKKG